MRVFLALTAAGTVLAGCMVQPAAPAAERRIVAPVAKKRAMKLPARVNVLLPPALGLAAGAGKMQAADAASLIGNAGGTLVGAGAGNLVGAGAGNYAVRQAATAAPAGCGDLQSGQHSFVDLVSLNASAYLETARVVNGMLAALATAEPEPDVPFSFQTPAGAAATAVFTPRGEAGGLLRVAAGDAFDPAQLVVALAYESPTRGRMVYRSPEDAPPFGKLTIASSFDLAAGTVSADGASDAATGPIGTGQRVNVHWEFAAAHGATPFKMQASAFFRFADAPCETGARAMAVHVGADGRAAARMGRVLPGETAFSFTRNDDGGYAAETGTNTGFFLAPDGTELTGADAALEARLPGLADMYTPYPEDPGEAGEMGIGARFAWPE